MTKTELKKELEDLLKKDVEIEQLENDYCIFTTKYLLFTYDKEYNSCFIRLKKYHQDINVTIFNQVEDKIYQDTFQDFQSVYLEVQDIYTKKDDIIKILNRYLKDN